MDPQHFGVHGHQSQIVNNPTRRTGGLTERTPLTPYHLGITDSFLKGCVVLDSLPSENEESYAKGWYSGFTEESHAEDAESSQVSYVEAIRDKATGQSGSYGSIGFNSHAAADKCQDGSAEFSLFVGNLAAEVTDLVLQETFKVHYPSVKGARVVTDRTSGRSKGYGFVRFADKEEQMRSLTELNGQYCLTRPMHIGPGPASMPKGTSTFQSFLGTQNESDPNKTTVENLRQVFSQFGELSHVKMHEGKHCGTVQSHNRACAVEAMGTLNGIQLGGSNIRLAWAPSPSNKQ
ncbi:hypothetical protein MKW98_028896, partial [Papaver atlanticum]